MPAGQELTGAPFTAFGAQWRLAMFPGGVDETRAGGGNISAYLYAIHDVGAKDITVAFDLSIGGGGGGRRRRRYQIEVSAVSQCQILDDAQILPPPPD